MSEITVYTAQIGDSDPVFPPAVDNPDARFVCFSDGWNADRDPRSDSRMAARRAKILECTGSDVTVWIDADMQLLVDPADLVADAAKTRCAVVSLRHPDRLTIQQEARICSRLRLADPRRIRDQVSHYEKSGFRQRCLTTTKIVVRFRSPHVEAFEKLWWEQIEAWTVRDQLSVDYAAWRTCMRIGYLNGNYRKLRYARFIREARWK